MTNKVMCRWAHCENMYCVHRHPNLHVVMEKRNGRKIYCDRLVSHCASEGRQVKCVKVQKTTDINELKAGMAFVWGDLIAIHEVGEYAIVEYYEWQSDGVTLLTGSPDYGNIVFSCYCNGRDISRSTDSLDSALATCIAYKHDGVNSQAAHFFMKMIRNER